MEKKTLSAAAAILVCGLFVFMSLAIECYEICNAISIICMVLSVICFLGIGIVAVAYMITDNKEQKQKNQYYDRRICR